MELINRELIARLDMKDSAVWLATWGGCGFIKAAPGTIGTIGAIPLGMFLMMIGGWPWLLLGFIIVSAIGHRAAHKFETMSGEHDSSAIVIDEVAGMLLTMLFTVPTLFSIFIAFVLFRVFDIVKPWPVSWADKKLPGALGVMADDILAGIYAALCLWGLHYAGIG